MMTATAISSTAFGIQCELSQNGGPPKHIQFQQFPLQIGRDESSGLILSGLWVGKNHAELRSAPAGLMAIDQGTLVGTLVNGQRITEYGPLKPGDVIQIGGWSLKIAELLTAGSDVKSGEQVRIHQVVARLREIIDLRRKDWHGVSDEVVRSECRELIGPVVEEIDEFEGPAERTYFIERVIAESVGLGPLEQLFLDPDISEIMVNRYDQIFIEKFGVCQLAHVAFVSEDSVRAVIDRIVSPLGKRIDDASPMVDARLPDGSRVNAVIRPLAVKGPSLTIRRFMNKQLGPNELVDRGSASREMLSFLELAVRHRFNIVVAGGTGSGKTTLLNMLSQWIPAQERLVTIEDAAELRINHANLVSLEVRQSNAEGQGKVTTRDLLKNSLRMRPDRIVVGECRGGEALDMLQAMNTGHEGSLTTIHANTPRDALSRLEVMVMMAGFDLPLVAIREQIASAIDVLVQQQRCADGSRRIVSISEVTGVETGVIQTQEIFSWKPESGRFESTGMLPHCFERLAKQGVMIDVEALLGFREITV